MTKPELPARDGRTLYRIQRLANQITEEWSDTVKSINHLCDNIGEDSEHDLEAMETSLNEMQELVQPIEKLKEAMEMEKYRIERDETHHHMPWKNR